MKICLAGWYFHAPFVDAIKASPYDAFVVKNREGDAHGIPSAMSEQMTPTGGRGLEFGCYQQFLANHWDGFSDVLFMQDDGVLDAEALGDIAALADKAGIDQAFIFRDEYEEFVNAGHSGRAFWMRGSFLQSFKEAGGFDVDWENTGDTVSRRANYGIHHFAMKMYPHPKCGWVAIIPGLQMGRRGWIPNQPWQYKRTEGQNGLVTPECVL